MIPERLRAAARQARDVAGPVSLVPATGTPGELAIAHATSGGGKTHALTRVVAVVLRDESTKTVTIQLATNEIDQATDLDLIVRPGEAGTPFAVVVQSELYGPLFTDQLAGSVGRLDAEPLAAVSHALLTDGESLDGFHTGPPLAGLDDPRREFKERELNELEHLVTECRKWLAGEAAPDAVLDPMLLIPPPPGTPTEIAEERFLELLDVVNALDEGPIVLPSEFLASTDDLLDELLRWRRDFGLDASRVLTRIRITEVEADLPGASAPVDDVFNVDDSTVVLTSYLTACASVGKATVDIHSVARCWGDRQPIVVAASKSRFCRGHARAAKAA